MARRARAAADGALATPNGFGPLAGAGAAYVDGWPLLGLSRDAEASAWLAPPDTAAARARGRGRDRRRVVGDAAPDCAPHEPLAACFERAPRCALEDVYANVTDAGDGLLDADYVPSVAGAHELVATLFEPGGLNGSYYAQRDLAPREPHGRARGRGARLRLGPARARRAAARPARQVGRQGRRDARRRDRRAARRALDALLDVRHRLGHVVRYNEYWASTAECAAIAIARDVRQRRGAVRVGRRHGHVRGRLGRLPRRARRGPARGGRVELGGRRRDAARAAPAGADRVARARRRRRRAAALPADFFSARWEALILLEGDGDEYTFAIEADADAAVTLAIDGVALIDAPAGAGGARARAREPSRARPRARARRAVARARRDVPARDGRGVQRLLWARRASAAAISRSCPRSPSTAASRSARSRTASTSSRARPTAVGDRRRLPRRYARGGEIETVVVEARDASGNLRHPPLRHGRAGGDAVALLAWLGPRARARASPATSSTTSTARTR